MKKNRLSTFFSKTPQKSRFQAVWALFDWRGVKLEKYLNIKGGINNITDIRYYTRRSGGYPGPGILPGEGRTAYFSIGAKF